MKIYKISAASILSCVLLLMVSTSVYAGDPSQWSDPWSFHVNVYGWLPEAPATINVADRTVVDAPEDLDTILDSLNMTAMFELEAHKGPLMIFANTIYYDGDYSDDFGGPISGASRRYKLEEEVWAIRYGAGYRVASLELGGGPDGPVLNVYPWVGGFYFNDDYSVTIEPHGTALDGFRVNGTFEFNTPMVGLVQRVDFSERWFLNLDFGYGGWDVDSVKEIWDFVGVAGYNFTMWGVSSKAFAGYRYLSIDWEVEPKEVRVDVKGPLLGIGWEF